MSRRQKLSLLQVMEKLSETDHGSSSEDKDDIEDELRWYESETKLDALSYINSKTDGSDTEPEDVSVSQEVCVKDGYLWKMELKTARRTPR